MEELARLRAGHLKVALMNADRDFLFATRLGLQGVPKFILFRGGERVAELNGAPQKDQLRAWVDQALAWG